MDHGLEGYSNHFLCKTMNISALNELSNHTRINKNKRLFPKPEPFGFKVMTNFTTHDYCFTTFRRHPITNEYKEHN